jgi:aldose 1-epimerase
VPVSFGFHPYLTIEGHDRSAWQVELPASRRLVLDELMIPTGIGAAIEPRRFTLADSDWDDGLTDLEPTAAFVVSAGARRIELRFCAGYSHAQIYAPPGRQFICFEPMTAPTNALVSRDALPVVDAGASFRAAFSISAA